MKPGNDLDPAGLSLFAAEPPLASNVPSNKQASEGWGWPAARRPNWLISR
jgi:hypothetical protein